MDGEGSAASQGHDQWGSSAMLGGTLGTEGLQPGPGVPGMNPEQLLQWMQMMQGHQAASADIFVPQGQPLALGHAAANVGISQCAERETFPRIGRPKGRARKKEGTLQSEGQQRTKSASPLNDFKGRGIGWNVCSQCRQLTSVEAGYPLAQDDWVCTMNTWNPALAQCCSEEQWNNVYDQSTVDRPGRVQPTVHGEPIKFWWLYNMVTQMGGWDTVKTFGWLPLIYEDRGWTSTSIGHRLKVLYESHLLEFERVNFHGKRYSAHDDQLRLFRPLSDFAGHPQHRFSFRRPQPTQSQSSRHSKGPFRGVAGSFMMPQRAGMDSMYKQYSGMFGVGNPNMFLPQMMPSMSGMPSAMLPYMMLPRGFSPALASPGSQSAVSPLSMPVGQLLDPRLFGSFAGTTLAMESHGRPPTQQPLGSSEPDTDFSDQPPQKRARSTTGAAPAPSPEDPLPRHFVCWNACARCGQFASVEAPHPAVRDRPWCCVENTWNPALAQCCFEAHWEMAYQTYAHQRGVPVEPTGTGLPFSLWRLYNVVTQLGGWESVVRHRRLPHACGVAGWDYTNNEGPITEIYERRLLPFESLYFTGKRYTTPEEAAQLERNAPPEAEGATTCTTDPATEIGDATASLTFDSCDHPSEVPPSAVDAQTEALDPATALADAEPDQDNTASSPKSGRAMDTHLAPSSATD